MAFNPPLTIKVKRQRDAVYDTYAGVTSYREGQRKIPDGLYRNNWTSAATAGIKAFLGATTVSGVVDALVDVVPTGANVIPDPDSYASLKITAPDVRTHTPPRQRWKIISGVYIAINDAVIPEPPPLAEHLSNSRIFTATDKDICSITLAGTFTAATTDIITSSTHGLITGDVVRVSSTVALPSGLAPNTDYEVVYISANTFYLYTTAGDLVDITGIGSGTHTWSRVDAYHGFEAGDIVGVVSEGTIPPGLDSTVRYQFVSLDASNFRLLTEEGAPVNITGAGSGRHMVTLLDRPVLSLPDNLPEGVTFYEYPYNLSVLP